ncbi:MAG: hypothetical protein PGN13_07420 [Patulibacter minatonensis]
MQAAEVPDALRAKVMAEVRSTPAPRRRARFRWPLSSMLIALVAAGGVATAGGLLISQATKDRANAQTTQPEYDGGSGLPLRYGRSIELEAKRYMRQLPYPPGMRDPMDWRAYRPSSAAGEMQGTVDLLVEWRATCLWRSYWVKAYTRGDRLAAADAAEILGSTTRWPAVRADRVGDRADALRKAARAAAASDVDAVRASLQFDCDGIP